MSIVTYEARTFSDNRGVFSNVNFNNGLIGQNFSPKRIYTVMNFKDNFVRAFHGHRYESKMILCVRGAVEVKQIPMLPNGELEEVHKCTSKVILPGDCAIYIPSGTAHGWKSLLPESMIVVASDKLMEESLLDDYRFDANIVSWEAQWR